MDISACVAHLDKSNTYDPRYTLRCLRALPSIYHGATPASLADAINAAYGAHPQLAHILGLSASSEPPKEQRKPSPETDCFLLLLVSAWCSQNVTDSDSAERALAAGKLAVEAAKQYNRRSLDYIEAKAWFFYVQSAFRAGSGPALYPQLMAALRTSSLRHDNETTAMLVVLLLRVLLAENKVSQAANLVSKTTFPESASNSLVARYMYYNSRINTVQLDYSTAHQQITQAIRKCPQTASATGFLQEAHKLSVVIELLMGEVPSRETFKKPEFEAVLSPYFALARAVRFGDVQAFEAAISEHAAALRHDNLYRIALRLHQNVIKTAIRVISLTYSRISLKDMAIKLHLDSEESTEYIVGKAIRDAVIDAEINHVKGYMQSRETLDVYATQEPRLAFHERIKFCITLHDDSVRAMRYLGTDHRSDLKVAEEAREREKELVTEIQEGTDLEDYDPDFDL